MQPVQLISLLLLLDPILSFCPPGCGCDDTSLSVSCLHTDLRVMPISLNPGVKLLVLKFNQFSSVDASLAFYSSLVLLDLSSNSLNHLPARVFQAQGELKKLKLGWNNLSSLLPGTFTDLHSFISLSLRGNSIKNLGDEVFSSLSQLRTLDPLWSNQDPTYAACHHRFF